MTADWRARLAAGSRWALVLLFVALHLAQLGSGLADNGDFTRVMTLFTAGPVDIEPNWPEPEGSKLWQRRFLSYWIPEWKLDFSPRAEFYSSVQLLWLPGAVLNWLVYSPRVLLMPFVSLVPRLLLLALLLLLLRAIDGDGRGPARRVALSLAAGLPFVLLTTTADVVVYLNSFYQETASLVFSLAALAALAWTRRRQFAPRSAWLAVGLVVLAATAKTSCAWWPAVAVAVLVPGMVRNGLRPRHWVGVTLVAAATVPLTMRLTSNPTIDARQVFQAVFYGSLLESARPQAHIERLGLADAEECVGHHGFDPVGVACVARLTGRVSLATNLSIMLHEPAVVPRLARVAAGEMQLLDTALGRYAYGDSAPPWAGLTNLWGALQRGHFPRGWPLLAVLGALALGPWLLRPRSELGRDARLVASAAAAACLLDMGVAVAGCGRADLLKHLYLANVLFSTAVIAAAALVADLAVGGPGRLTAQRTPRPGAR